MEAFLRNASMESFLFWYGFLIYKHLHTEKGLFMYSSIFLFFTNNTARESTAFSFTCLAAKTANYIFNRYACSQIYSES